MNPLILIVDDDALLCNLLRIALERAGYRTRQAFSGEQTLEYLAANPADLLLLDIMMADMGGFDVLQNIRQNPQLRDLPIIILTARADAESRTRGMMFGANKYLVKPLPPDKILVHIREVLAEKAAASDAADVGEPAPPEQNHS